MGSVSVEQALAPRRPWWKRAARVAALDEQVGGHAQLFQVRRVPGNGGLGVGYGVGHGVVLFRRTDLARWSGVMFDHATDRATWRSKADFAVNSDSQ